MSFPSVIINALNRHNGTTKTIERTALFVAKNALNNRNGLIALSQETKLEDVVDNSLARAQIEAARTNAGADWLGYLWEVPSNGTFADGVRQANEIGSFEYIVDLTYGEKNREAIQNAQTLSLELLNTYQRRTFFILPITVDTKKKTWAQISADLVALQRNLVGDHVMLVPELFGNETGALAGRLANSAVTIADSPARVKTGAVMNLSNPEIPSDKEGRLLDIATLKTLERARFTVVMWYPDYDGFYFSDGRTLDVEGGDYQSIENVRVVDKACRRIRLQAISKVADRSFNSTIASIELHKTLFTEVLREMSKSVQIGTELFPGECYPPDDDSIVIVWENKTTVQIYVMIRPLECPKTIKASVMLDLKTIEGEQQ